MVDNKAPAKKRAPRAKAPEAQPSVKTTGTSHEDKKCPYADTAQTVIEWLSIVDDFKISDHKNFLPRWAFLLIILTVLQIT